MPEASLAGTKVISVLIGIVGVLLLVVGVTSILAISIPGLPPEIVSALASLSSNAYIQIIYGLIAIGIAAGLWGARAWAAGAAGVLLLIILVSTGFSIYSLWTVYGLSGLYTLLTSLSIPLIITIVTFIVALASIIYLVAASGWR